MSTGTFDSQVFNLLREMDEAAKELKVTRVSSPMVLRTLLSAKQSPLYNAILSQLMEDITCFPEMLDETYAYIEPPLDDLEQNQEAMEDSEEVLQITLAYEEGESTIFFDDDLAEFITLIIVCIQNGINIDTWKFTALFVKTMSLDVRTILRTFGVRTELLEQYFMVKSEEASNKRTNENSPVDEAQKPFTIPEELRGFVRDLTEELKSSTCDISGRENECRQVWQTMSKHTKRNVALIGEPGVGKTSIAMKIAYEIINGICPKEFQGFKVLSLDVASSVAGTMYRGQAEQRYSALVDFLENQPNVILFIDEIHLINGAGACREGEVDLANTLKPILAGGKVRVIGATTQDEYEKYFSRDGALKRRFHPVYVKEPKTHEVYPMLKKSIEALSTYHGVSISKEMVDFIILNAACFNNETRNPDRTKDLIDLSMVVAKQAGKKAVDKESVLANFAYEFRKFEKMSDHAKRSTAYHEAGHCLVAYCSKELIDYDVLAVSIMPAEHYLGITVFEENDVTPEPTMDYYIDSIAMRLAGREAEATFTHTITSGASADLNIATRIARDIVAKFGMSEFGKNRSYSQETQSEETINKINKEIDEIIEKARSRAYNILFANMEQLELLVDALMTKGIVGSDELKKILKNIKKI